MELRILLQERVKGALICARFTKLRDMDAPTTFFFNLEKSSRTGEADGLPSSAKRPSYNRSSWDEKTCNGVLLISFRMQLWWSSGSRTSSRASSTHFRGSGIFKHGLDIGGTYNSGYTDGFWEISRNRWFTCGLFKHFWNVLGNDLLDVFNDSFVRGTLPVSCQQGALSLLPKKGDLALLKNWRPVTFLCRL